VSSLIELIDGAEPISKAEPARLARNTASHSAPLTLIQDGRK